MARIKFDENVADSVCDVLRAAGHDVAMARDEQLAGVDDERLLAVAVSEGRALVTSDYLSSGSKPLALAELSPWTFWSFAREFSPIHGKGW